MAEVYKFKISLESLDKHIWRDIEITSVSSVAKLGYAVLAAFKATASHLFCVKFAGVNYEFMFDGVEKEAVNPAEVKLSSLKLKTGDILTMEYDYGAGWRFNIELMSVAELKAGEGTHYPYVADGKGRGIIEDTSSDILAEYIEQIDIARVLPTYYDSEQNREVEWDYRKFDLKTCNMLYKAEIEKVQEAYERLND